MGRRLQPGALKAIGASSLLGAVGLILPAILDIAPVLVPVTATCVALLFVGAVMMRLRRGEKATIVGDLVSLLDLGDRVAEDAGTEPDASHVTDFVTPRVTPARCLRH